VFYTGAAPNQQAIPAVEYLMSPEGGSVKRWVLEGTDYVYPRTTNKILEAFLKAKGVAPEDIKINYTPFGFSDWQTEVAAIKQFASGGKKTAVVSTINGDANVPFYKELANAGIKAKDIPVVAFSVGEEELAGIDTKNLVGHLAAWNYFESVKSPVNDAFIRQWHDFIKDPKRVTNDPMEAHYIGFKMWVQAVEQAGTTDIDAVRQAMYGQKVKAPSGFTAVMNTNHHLSKPVMIGEIQANGQFDVVWQTKEPIKADAWSPHLPEDKGKVADWSYPWVCGNCTAPKYTN
jgi:urea transport system substrate-binding protein